VTIVSKKKKRNQRRLQNNWYFLGNKITNTTQQVVFVFRVVTVPTPCDNSSYMIINEFTQLIDTLPNSARMPIIFVGHGSPLNAIEHNSYTSGWEELGTMIPRPRAILIISAHWVTEGTFVHISGNPKTIHDFWGFPETLSTFSYPAPGAPQYAHAVRGLVSDTEVRSDTDWGLDHGAWVPLARMFPEANIPVFQMSMDSARTNEQHYALAKELSSLREKGVLIIGSGNIVHNLGMIDWTTDAQPLPFATEFDEKVKELINSGDHESLIHHEKLGHNATLAIPTPEHFWPLLYCLALQEKNELITYPVEGIAQGSISMRVVQIG